MRNILISAALMLGFAFAANSQEVIVVNSETIFKSLAEYNDAITTVDKLAEQYQATVDNAFAELERTYNDYQNQRPYLSESARQQREDAIIAREQEILDYQQRMFSQEGDLIKKRVELIKPIQDRVFAVINNYAQSNGHSMVIDIATDPSVLYYSPGADKTQQIISQLK